MAVRGHPYERAQERALTKPGAQANCGEKGKFRQQTANIRHINLQFLRSVAMLYIKLQKSLPVQLPWVTLPPVRLGKVPSGLGTADLFVTIEDDDGPILRADLYVGQSPFLKQEAKIWGDRGFVGFGNSVYVIDPKTQSGSVIHLGSYFADFYPTTEYLLVASGCGVMRFHQSERSCGRPPALRWMV
jgi:hypothetical protein